MYIAQKRSQTGIRYILRQSVTDNPPLGFVDVMDLGPDPSKFIRYPGGNAFYIAPEVEAAFESKSLDADPEELEDLFWPFIRPDIRRAVSVFRDRSKRRHQKAKLTEKEAEEIMRKVHEFDKRRVNYLKFGHMDQGPTCRMPPILFRHLLGKSRDEIEQGFMQQESILNASELKTYVYVALDLQRFFPNFMAKKMPHVLDQDKVDQHFIEQLCQINQDLFGTDNSQSGSSTGGLHEYLTRYVIMFFDNEYENTTLLDDFAKDFMYRHHFYRPMPAKPHVSMEDAADIFNVKPATLKNITRKGITRLYRKMALKYHPDMGGSNDQFVKLTRAYRSVLDRIKKK